MPKLAIVVPCFNEEQVFATSCARLLELLDQLVKSNKISPTSELWFVDDGSIDSTWSLIRRISSDDARVHGIKLSRNHGHQRALLAGLLSIDADVTISIDADLQDDIRVIEQMIDAHLSGKDIVFGVRSGRQSDSWHKRFTAEAYYRLLRRMGTNIVFNHADFRLMSRRAINALRQYHEVNLFLRGLIPTLGFPTAIVEYERLERSAGTTKYNLRKMLSLALEGITSFSTVPLRMIATLGVLIFFGSLILSGWVMWTRFASNNVVPGWASSVLPMYLLGGIQLLSIGVLGEYIAKIYMETKGRPRFIVEEMI